MLVAKSHTITLSDLYRWSTATSILNWLHRHPNGSNPLDQLTPIILCRASARWGMYCCFSDSVGHTEVHLKVDLKFSLWITGVSLYLFICMSMYCTYIFKEQHRNVDEHENEWCAGDGWLNKLHTLLRKAFPTVIVYLLQKAYSKFAVIAIVTRTSGKLILSYVCNKQKWVLSISTNRTGQPNNWWENSCCWILTNAPMEFSDWKRSRRSPVQLVKLMFIDQGHKGQCEYYA